MSLTRGYSLSREAARDVREIEDYSARKWGDERTALYLNDIFVALKKLADKPDLGRRRNDVPPPYLVYSVGSHIIIYRHNTAKALLEVLNILHPAQDVKLRVLKALQRRNDH